jgi:DNA-binding transcriptional ArsR family regulator
MLEHGTAERVFHALGDATRRTLVLQLSRGPASVSELARPLPISLAAVVQHVQVLESSGLVATHKQGRVRTCHLEADALLAAERWLAQRRAMWEGRLERLDALVRAWQPPPTPPAEERTTPTPRCTPRRERRPPDEGEP